MTGGLESGRKERDVGSHFAFFLCSVQGPSPWVSTVHIQHESSLLIALTGTPRSVSKSPRSVTLNPVQLMIKISHHSYEHALSTTLRVTSNWLDTFQAPCQWKGIPFPTAQASSFPPLVWELAFLLFWSIYNTFHFICCKYTVQGCEVLSYFSTTFVIIHLQDPSVLTSPFSFPVLVPPFCEIWLPWVSHISKNHTILLFHICLVLLSIMSLKFIHVVEHARIFFLLLNNIPLCR